tara:strand:- start:6 stop:560 length:555 start_codon:yes stop_codon:yes gene_type:complete
MNKIKKFPRLIFYLIFSSTSYLSANMIYDFKENSNLEGWYVIDDNVMGGQSYGSLKLDEKGNGVFTGNISLRNYGGFSSIRFRNKKIDVRNYQFIKIKVKGDNKYYQIRIKSRSYDRHSYTKKIFVTNTWNVIKVPLSSMIPQFRGRNLRMDNFNGNFISEFGILIGNKTEERFSLLIDYITLE